MASQFGSAPAANAPAAHPPADIPPQARVFQLMGAPWIARMLWATCKLGLPEMLTKRGPMSAAEIARELNLHERSLFRMLRAIAAEGFYKLRDDSKFEHTPQTELLDPEHPHTMRNMFEFHTEPWLDEVWHHILHTVRTGEKALDHLYKRPCFEVLFGDPEKGDLFNRAMTDYSSEIGPAVAAAYDFSGVTQLCDVAGGHGALLLNILARHKNITEGMVMELPTVVAGFDDAIRKYADKIKSAAGAAAVAEAQSRVRAVEGDFFKAVTASPAYIMCHIIHDWNDEMCDVILRNIRASIIGTAETGARLLIVDHVVPPGNEHGFAKLLDIQMMIAPGGQERTREEFTALLARNGFRVTRFVPTAVPEFIVEAVPV